MIDKMSSTTWKIYEAEFEHPLKPEEITEENYSKVANDLYLLQSQDMIHSLSNMVHLRHWGDDDTDYHETMRDAHSTLQHIAYDGSREDLIKFLFMSRTEYEATDGRDLMPLHYIDSAGGLCEELREYLEPLYEKEEDDEW